MPRIVFARYPNVEAFSTELEGMVDVQEHANSTADVEQLTRLMEAVGEASPEAGPYAFEIEARDVEAAGAVILTLVERELPGFWTASAEDRAAVVFEGEITIEGQDPPPELSPTERAERTASNADFARAAVTGRQLVQIRGHDGSLAYEVELAQDDSHAVFVIKKRKTLPNGYAYAPGQDTYRSTIKPGSPIWKSMVKAAREHIAPPPAGRLPLDVECPHCRRKPGFSCVTVANGEPTVFHALTHRQRWQAVGISKPTAEDRTADYEDMKRRDRERIAARLPAPPIPEVMGARVPVAVAASADELPPRVMPAPWFKAASMQPPICLDLTLGRALARELAPGERQLGRFVLPPFQRPAVWTEAQQIRFLESLWGGLPLGSYVWNRCYGAPTNEWLLDGQQRWSALLAYVDDAFPVLGYRYSEITLAEKRGFNNRPFSAEMTELASVEECREVYDRLAYGGTPHAPKAPECEDCGGLHATDRRSPFDPTPGALLLCDPCADSRAEQQSGASG